MSFKEHPRASNAPTKPRASSEEQVANAVLRVLAEPLRQLLLHVLQGIPPRSELSEQDVDQIEEAKKRLLALWVPVPDADASNRRGYRWPASRLTAADMGKLHQMSLQTGRHITVLLHEAVSIMYDLTRSDMQKLLALREQTGLSIRELLRQAVDHLWNGQRDAGP